MRTSEQVRAENALARVGELNTEPNDLRQLYRAYVDL